MARASDRRQFLKFLVSSPLFALGGVLPGPLASPETAQAAESDGPKQALIASANDALNVFDFEPAAKRKVLPGHWAYMASGVDDDATLRANREGYSHVQLRPRRLRDQTKVDMKVDLWGTTYDSPIFLCPTGGEKSFHMEGEVAVPRAFAARATEIGRAHV